MQSDEKLDTLDKVLIRYNIIPGSLGYAYVKEILLKEMDLNVKRIEIIYDKVADEYHSTAGSVARAIRYILQKSNLVNKSNKAGLAYLQLAYREVRNSERK